MSDVPGKESAGFRQRLGLFDATMLVVGTMIGSGIFATSQSIAQDVGGSGWLLAVWVLAGVMTVMGALSYAELAGMMPQAGGQYVYLREAFSPLFGFLYGWTCFLIIQCGSIAAVAVIFAKHLGLLVPALGADPTDNFVFGYRGLNLELTLPWMSEPFFKMEDFVVTTAHLVAIAVIVFLTWLNCRGVQEGKVVQNVFTVAKTLALLALIVVGLWVVASPRAVALNTQDPWGGILETDRFHTVSRQMGSAGLLVALMVAGGAMVGALFSADAWNNVTFTAGEIKNPRRNLPLSLFVGAGSVVLLYVIANVAYMAALPVNGAPELAGPARVKADQAAQAERHGDTARAKALLAEREKLIADASTFERGIAFAKDQRVGTAVMELWSPTWGATLMALAIMISTFGCVNGMTLMGARLYCVMARDGLFFSPVGRLNRQGVPAVGLVLQGLWSVLLVFSGSYDDLLDYVIFAVLIFYALTVTGLFVLRVKRPDAERPYKAFGYPIVPAVYVILCLVIGVTLLFVKPKFTWPGLLIVLAGIPVYFLWRLFGARPQASGAA